MPWRSNGVRPERSIDLNEILKVSEVEQKKVNLGSTPVLSHCHPRGPDSCTHLVVSLVLHTWIQWINCLTSMPSSATALLMSCYWRSGVWDHCSTHTGIKMEKKGDLVALDMAWLLVKVGVWVFRKLLIYNNLSGLQKMVQSRKNILWLLQSCGHKCLEGNRSWN